MNRNAVKRNCLCAVKRSTMSEFFEFPQKQLINISVSIVEILPRRTFVRRRSAFGDSSSFLTPPDNRKAQTETENSPEKRSYGAIAVPPFFECSFSRPFIADYPSKLRHYRVIPMVQLRSWIFRQTIQKFAGCSSATGKDFCEV